MKRTKLAALLGAGLLTLGVAGTTLAVTYATVTGHAAFSAESNDASFWGDNCSKLDDPGGGSLDSYELTQDYAKVIVKAGSGTYANTIFDNPTSGQTVWADTNGNNTFDPGGADGDKTISHIIFCGGTSESSAPSEQPSQGGGGDTNQPTQPSTDALGTSGQSGPSDTAWLLVVALGVLLASVVVLTPARSKTRR